MLGLILARVLTILSENGFGAVARFRDPKFSALTAQIDRACHWLVVLSSHSSAASFWRGGKRRIIEKTKKSLVTLIRFPHIKKDAQYINSDIFFH